jgi:hypothetical protein
MAVILHKDSFWWNKKVDVTCVKRLHQNMPAGTKEGDK